MKVRRYRDGRLIRSREWRRATLQSERDLVLLRLGGMLAAVDRFELMLRALRIAGSQDTAVWMTDGQLTAGCSGAQVAANGTDPDRREAWPPRDAGPDKC